MCMCVLAGESEREREGQSGLDCLCVRLRARARVSQLSMQPDTSERGLYRQTLGSNDFTLFNRHLKRRLC